MKTAAFLLLCAITGLFLLIGKANTLPHGFDNDSRAGGLTVVPRNEIGWSKNYFSMFSRDKAGFSSTMNRVIHAGLIIDRECGNRAISTLRIRTLWQDSNAANQGAGDTIREEKQTGALVDIMLGGGFRTAALVPNDLSHMLPSDVTVVTVREWYQFELLRSYVCGGNTPDIFHFNIKAQREAVRHRNFISRVNSIDSYPWPMLSIEHLPVNSITLLSAHPSPYGNPGANHCDYDGCKRYRIHPALMGFSCFIAGVVLAHYGLRSLQRLKCIARGILLLLIGFTLGVAGIFWFITMLQV